MIIVNESLASKVNKIIAANKEIKDLQAKSDDNIDKNILKVNNIEIDINRTFSFSEKPNIYVKGDDIVIEGDLISSGKFFDMSSLLFNGTMKIKGTDENIIRALPKSITENSVILFYDCDWCTDEIVHQLNEKYHIDGSGNNIINFKSANIKQIKYTRLIGEHSTGLLLMYLYDVVKFGILDLKNVCVPVTNQTGAKFKKLDIDFSSNLFDFIYLNRNIYRVYFDIAGELREGEGYLENFLKYCGDKVGIRMSCCNLRIKNVPSEKTIMGLPLKMKPNTYISIKTPTDDSTNALLQKYISTHDPKIGDGSNSYFNVVLV